MIAYIGAVEGDGLTVAEVDPATGALTALGVVDVPEPSFLALSPDGRALYAVDERPEGAVTALDLADPRRPVVRGARPTGGAGPTHLCVSGGFLLVAHYTDGTVSAHRIEDDGGVGERTALLRHAGDRPHAHQVVVDPSGRWVLAVDLGADAVFTHRLDRRTGELAPHARLDLPAGTGPRHLAFAPDGLRAYVLGELTPGVAVARWDAAAGTLSVEAHVPVTGPGAPDPTYPAEVLVDAGGGRLYASTRGEDAIAVLDLTATPPALRQSAPTGGAWPRHCALDPAGTRMYVANQRTGTVTWLPVDPGTGELGGPAGSLPVRGASMVAFG